MSRNQLNEAQGYELADARLGVHVAARAILRRGKRPVGAEAHAMAEDVYGAINAETGRVMGNRPGNAAVTWDDARLMLAATLRDCLALLEGER